MKMKILKKDDFITSKWSGGETTQLYIYPENAVLENRDFLWRISSATFTGLSSKFSNFTGYMRYLLPLEGEITVYHNNDYDRKLIAYDIEYFNGAWETIANNTFNCQDYNFIVKDNCQAELFIGEVGRTYELKPNSMVTLFSKYHFKVDFGLHGSLMSFEANTLLLIEVEEFIQVHLLEQGGPVIFTQIKTGHNCI